MDCSCTRFLQLKQSLNIKNRIKYYLGPLYYEDKVYVDNLIGIEDLNIIDHTEELKNMLVKYKFQDKKFLYSNHDIQHEILEYRLVRNRWKYNNNTIILKTINNYDYSWGKFYNTKDINLFENKINKVFWRGSTTGQPSRPGNRFTLITTYFNKYNDIDVAFTGICQGKHAFKKYVKRKVSHMKFLEYKYLLSIAGNDAPCGAGLSWKLNTNSLVLMPKPRAFSWLMEDRLIPNYHYVLLKDDFSDLREKLDWCKANQDKCKKIIEHAHQYMEIFRNINVERDIEGEVLKLYFEKLNNKV